MNGSEFLIHTGKPTLIFGEIIGVACDGKVRG